MIEDKLDNIQIKLEKIIRKVGKKNSHLHILIETPLLNKLKEEAKLKELSLAELCRRKLNSDFQFNLVEED